MWSLPDIKRLNAEAAEKARIKGETLSEPGAEKQGDMLTGEFTELPEPIVEPNEEDYEECEWCEDRAEHTLEWYDIFSDDPKGEMNLCEEHYEDRIYSDSYFECDTCDRLMIMNYTWENYYVVGDGYIQCLRCAFEEFIKEPTIAITKDNVDDIMEDIAERRFDALEEICPHLIAVSSTYWEDSLEFQSNHEFSGWEKDGTLGTLGTSWVRFTNDIRLAVREYGTVYLIHSAYQFSISIGIYTPKQKGDLS